MDRSRTPARAWLLATVLLALLGLAVLPVLGPRLWTCADGNPRIEALLRLKYLETAVSIFQQRHGRPPASLEELTRPLGDGEEALVERLDPDPWGRAFEWRREPDGRSRLASRGPDGLPETADDLFWPEPGR